MSDLILSLRVPYTQDYYYPRARRPNRKSFWSDDYVTIREVGIEDLRPAYRIVLVEQGGARGRMEPYVVSTFEDGCWWPLLGTDRFVSSSDFVERARVGDRNALAALGVRFEFAGPETWEEFSENKRFRLGSSTRDEQWECARRGARCVVVCEGRIYAEVGEPIYYAIPQWPDMRYRIEAGPVPLTRTDRSEFRLPGPGLSKRLDSARKGFAFGIEEVDSELERLVDWRNEGFISNIEVLSDRRPGDFAVRHCASAFIDLLWVSMKIPDSQRSRFLRRALPILSGEKELSDVRRLSQRAVLNDVVSMDETGSPESYASLKSDAADLLRRLGPLPLTPEEDDWLSRLAP